MDRIKLSKPIKVKLADGREVDQDYLEFSRITVADAKKYLSGSFLAKKMEYQEILMELHDQNIKDESEEEKDRRLTSAGLEASKAFFKIFNDDDIIKMITALSKLPVEAIEQIDFFDISEMVAGIANFLFSSQMIVGKQTSGQ